MRSSSLRNRRNRRTSSLTSGSPPTSAVDIYLSRFASASTVGALALAAFGYFYTVLPVFQNQKLQEDNAKLELENAKAKENLSSLQEYRSTVQREIGKLNSALLDAQTAITVSNERAKDAEKREATAKSTATLAKDRARVALASANAAEVKLVSELENLDFAHRAILIVQFRENFLFARIRSEAAFIDELYLKRDGDKTNGGNGIYLINAMNRFPFPNNVLKMTLENFSKSLEKMQLPHSYFLELNNEFSKEMPITCAVPNIDELVSSYRNTEGQIHALSAKDSQEQIEKQRVNAESAGRRLLVQEGDIENFTRGNETARRYKLDEEYRDILSNASKQCSELLEKVVKRVTKKVASKKGKSIDE